MCCFDAKNKAIFNNNIFLISSNNIRLPMINYIYKDMKKSYFNSS